jgi:hypothetical protein
MAPSEIRCPHCLTAMRPAAGARAVRCPGCGGAVQVPAAAVPVAARPAATAVARTVAPVPAVARVAVPKPQPPRQVDSYDSDRVPAPKRQPLRLEDEDDEPRRFGKRSKSGGRPERKKSASDNHVILAVVGGVGALFVVGMGVVLGIHAVSRSVAPNARDGAPPETQARSPRPSPPPRRSLPLPGRGPGWTWSSG